MNTKVYIYRSRVDGTFFATTTPLPSDQVSSNIFDNKDIPEGVIKNKEDLRNFLAEWEGIVDDLYLKHFARHVKNLMYNENK